MTAVAALSDLLASLLSEAELRRLFADHGLGDDLPGAGVTHAELCHQAAALVLRRGLADQAFFQRLADRAGAGFPRVVEVAAQLGVSGLRAPPPRPVPSDPGSAPAAPTPLRATLRIRPRRLLPAVTAVALVLGLITYVWWRRAPPCATLDETLTNAGFTLNPGLSARMMPGTVLRVCEPGASGPARLKAPVVWATAADCFAGLVVQEANWEIPQHTCGSGMELGLEATDLTSWLPGLSAHASALRDASLELIAPRIVSLPEMTLGSGFSPECASKLAASLTPPVQASWFQVVREAIVLDGLTLRVYWKGGLDASARLAAEEGAVGSAKASGLELKAATRSEDETIWEAEGPLVLGWRGATARPNLAGGAVGPSEAGGCL